MTNLFEPMTLCGDYCTLVPLSYEHNDDLRDTYVYSITSSEWPTVKAHLEFLKNKTRQE